MSNIKNTIKYSIGFSFISLAVLAFGAVMPTKANAQVYQDNGFSQRTTLTPVYTTQNNPVPSVNSISPNSANVGNGPVTVTITGEGFTTSSVARWNGSAHSSTFIDSNHLLIYLNSGDLYGSSGRYINVFNPGPGGGYSNSNLFTINGYVAPRAATTGGTGASGNSSKTYSSGSAQSSTSGNSGSVQGAQTSAQPNTNDSGSSLAGAVIYGSNSFMPSGLIQWLLFAIFILIIVIIVRKIFFKDKYNSTPLKHA
jgi:hypothetical protein